MAPAAFQAAKRALILSAISKLDGVARILDPDITPDLLRTHLGRHRNALMDLVAGQLHLILNEERAAQTKALFGELPNENLRSAIENEIVEIDRLIAGQLDTILHHPWFQKLEGSWRGLHWLAEQMGGFDTLRLRLLDVAWGEIARDLEGAPAFDMSILFHRLYEEAFGIAGGEPFGLLVVDHAVRHRRPDWHEAGKATAWHTARRLLDERADDIGTLETLAEIGSVAFMPVLLTVSAELFGANQIADLAFTADPGAQFQTDDYSRWRDLAALPATRFLALVTPRLLARPAWKADATRAETFRYDEDAGDASRRVWMSGAYALAAVAARSFQLNGWPIEIRGAGDASARNGGGVVASLPADPFRIGPRLTVPRHPLELAFLEAQERSLAQAGLTPLVPLPFGIEPMFGTVRSLYEPAAYTGTGAVQASADARISSQLNAILCAARFAHCLKIRGRQTLGQFPTAEALEADLSNWLNRYVNTNPHSGPEERARKPLVRASVRIQGVDEKPGVFRCQMELQPHFQLDHARPFAFDTQIAA